MNRLLFRGEADENGSRREWADPSKMFSPSGQRQRFQGVKLCDERGAERDSLLGLGVGTHKGQGRD